MDGEQGKKPKEANTPCEGDEEKVKCAKKSHFMICISGYLS